MSNKRFQEAKGSLAHSQSILDHLQGAGQQQPEQENGMEQPQNAPMEQPEAPQEGPHEERQEEQSIAQTIKDTLTPFMGKITELISKKDDQPKDVTVKMDGQIEPK